MGKAKQISVCAVLTALALALSYTERFLPLQAVLGLPGMKLGLANTVTLLALCLFKTPYAAMILFARCLLGAVFGGGITGLAFSLTGGFLALGVMAAAIKMRKLSLYGVSVLGAAAHNVGQILAAMALMNSRYVAAYLPYLLVAAVVTGLAVAGLCAGVLRVLPTALLPRQMGRWEEKP